MIFLHDTQFLVNTRSAKGTTVDMNANSETGDYLGEIYEWIDQIKFSRPKRNIARDFSDGGKKGVL